MNGAVRAQAPPSEKELLPPGRVRGIVEAVAALTLLVLLAPVLALAALAVRLSSPGPVIFRQQRLGIGEQPFVVLKLRTMTHGADDAIHRRYVTRLLTEDTSGDTYFKLTDDPRITRVGAVLRATSIDELPQLWNVVRGEMSFVGPRPVLAWEAALFDPADCERFRVRPGLTCLWQVSGRSRRSMHEQLALDVEYVRRRSLALDLAILARTLPAVLRPGSAR